MKDKFRKQEEVFDERQLQIQGRVFKRGYLILLCFVLLNGYLSAWGIVWASGFWQSLVTVMLVTVIISLEFIIKGVYFGKNIARPWAIVCLGVFAAINIAGVTNSLSSGVKLIENNALTDPACSAIVALLAVVLCVACIIKYVYDIKQEKEKD